MCNRNAGRTRYFYTGDQVGFLNFTGDYGFASGGPPGSGLAAGTTQGVFFPNTLNRRPWQNDDAVFNDTLLDICYPNIDIQWIADIQFKGGAVFHVSDRAFYVNDKDGNSIFYDARAEKPPAINVDLGEWLSPAYKVSDMILDLNNRDGFFNPYLPFGDLYEQWSNASVTIKIGIGEDFNNYFTLFQGNISIQEGITSTRDTLEIKAFDKMDIDQIPIPPNVFDTQSYPTIDPNFSGKNVPLIYGDWTENVQPWGNLPAVCINATDTNNPTFDFKVSDLSLQSIPKAFLHRGDRNAATVAGPIPFDMSTVTLNLASGQFSVPKGVDVFQTQFVLASNLEAGPSTTTNLIGAKDGTVDFVALGIQAGDQVLVTSTNTYYTISSVSTPQLTISGTLTVADAFLVLTKKYTFLDNDKISVTCTGKNLNLVSTTAVASISKLIINPQSISVGYNGTYWISDNATQKIYNVDFRNNILSSFAFSAINPAITHVSGISASVNGMLWIVDSDAAQIYNIDPISVGVGFTFNTSDVIGIGTVLPSIADTAVQPDSRLWIVDQASGNFYLIDNPASAPNNTPTVVRSFNKSAFDSSATNITGLGYDSVNNQLLVTDRTNNKFYRIDAVSGMLVTQTPNSVFDPNATFVTSVSVAQDGTLFFIDAGLLNVYDYNDASYASVNPCFIARDLLQNFGGHTYDEFDLSWNNTARQLSTYKCRASITDNITEVTYIYALLQQYNIAFSLKFQKFSLFWINFNNFVTTGKATQEKDLQDATFAPAKEISQYFNSATTTYAKDTFQNTTTTSDTYYSLAGIAEAGKEINKAFTTPNLYRRQEVDALLPLMVRLAVPEPEFVTCTFGFRLIRSQIQDFLSLTFDGFVDLQTGKKVSGRRFNQVPCMIRKISFDLTTMTVGMKLWSLGNTQFNGYTPPGATVGGQGDTIVLTAAGRFGRISPIGNVTASSGTTITLANYLGQNAQTRTDLTGALTWLPGYTVDVIDASTRNVLQTLTIHSVSGAVVTFVEPVTATVLNTVLDSDGFLSSGSFLQYASYQSSTALQKAKFGFFSNPTAGYPTTGTQELADQKAGVESFPDGGLPYVLYPDGFNPS